MEDNGSGKKFSRNTFLLTSVISFYIFNADAYNAVLEKKKMEDRES
jgi:hypothetical protein